MTYFNITKSDIQNKIDSVDVENKTDINIYYSNEDFEKIVKVWEDRVLSSLPLKYRKSLNIIHEAISYRSKTKTNIFKTSLTPKAGTQVKVYINLCRSWEYRSDDDISKIPYTVSGNTITFDRDLEIGSVIFAEYEHDNAEAFAVIKDIIENYIAIEIDKRLIINRSDAGSQRFIHWQEQSDLYLDKLQKGLVGIPVIDNIDKIDNKASNNIVEDFFETVLRL
jgi:hypothetical protein